MCSKNRSHAFGCLLLLLLFGAAPQLLTLERSAAAAKTRKPATQATDAALPATKPGAEDCLQVEECRQTVESARRLSESRQYNAALTGYEKAYAIRASSWLLINIGRVQQKLGRPADAVTSFNRFLADAEQQPAEVVTAAREYLKQAESDLAATRERERQASQPLAPSAATSATALNKTETKPVYKKWWFWLAIGGATAAVATAVAVGVTVGTAGSTDPQHAPFHIAF